MTTGGRLTSWSLNVHRLSRIWIKRTTMLQISVFDGEDFRFGIHRLIIGVKLSKSRLLRKRLSSPRLLRLLETTLMERMWQLLLFLVNSCKRIHTYIQITFYWTHPQDFQWSISKVKLNSVKNPNWWDSDYIEWSRILRLKDYRLHVLRLQDYSDYKITQITRLLRLQDYSDYKSALLTTRLKITQITRLLRLQDYSDYKLCQRL